MTVSEQKHHLLIVDDEAELVSSLRRGIAHSLKHVSVDGRTDPEDALRLVREQRFDLLITDVRMPRLNGLELLLAARRQWPALPFIVMTGFPADFPRQSAEGHGLVSYIEKPFELPSIVSMIDGVLRKQVDGGFSGDVILESIPDLVQLFSLSNLTGALRIRNAGDTGVVWFDRGAVVHATTTQRQGAEAFYAILGWDSGDFDMERGAVSPTLSIHESPTALVIEGMRRLDEAQRASARSGGPTRRGSLRSFAAPTENAYDRALAPLRSVEGYLGSALVDSQTASCVAHHGQGVLAAWSSRAALHGDVVRSHDRAISGTEVASELDDIVCAFSSQYHLYRPVPGRSNWFVLLVVDRARANLGLARMATNNVARQINGQ